MDKEPDEKAVIQQADPETVQSAALGGTNPDKPDNLEPGGSQTGPPPPEASDSFIPPSPLPVKADVKTIPWGDDTVVLVSMVTPAGMNYYFLNADGAGQFGRAILQASRDAIAAETKPTLTVVKKGLIKP